MNTPSKLFLGLLLLTGVCITSCNKDDDNDPVSCNWVTETQTTYTNLTTAVNAYINDPTQANCLAYKAAYQAYLNDIKDHRECAVLAGNQAEIDAAIQSAQAELDALQC